MPRSLRIWGISDLLLCQTRGDKLARRFQLIESQRRSVLIAPIRISQEGDCETAFAVGLVQTLVMPVSIGRVFVLHTATGLSSDASSSESAFGNSNAARAALVTGLETAFSVSGASRMPGAAVPLGMVLLQIARPDADGRRREVRQTV